jgi:hypothetical protein
VGLEASESRAFQIYERGELLSWEEKQELGIGGVLRLAMRKRQWPSWDNRESGAGG